MLAKILQWLREMLDKMINITGVKSTMGVDVLVSSEMLEALREWSLMYTNQASWLTKDIVSLNLPAAISSEISRAVTIEMAVAVEGSPRADYLSEQLAVLLGKIREATEYGVAKGGLMLKPYPKDEYICIDIVQADQFFPVAFDANGNITACVFSDQKVVGGKYFTRLEYHHLTPTGYVIQNSAFVSPYRDTLGNEIPLASVPGWESLQPEATVTNIDKPLFAYFRYPIANSIDPTSPLGISCFARAKELIEQADKQWSSFLWEMKSGERALYVDELAFEKDKTTGKPKLPDLRLYRALKTSGTVNNNELFEDWTPTMREENYLRALDATLRRIEFTCGLAYGVLSNPQSIDKTATELKISQQRSYATITDTQKALQEALDELLYAMDVWATLAGLAPKGSYTATYDFDDSIIVDKDLQFQQDMRLVTTRLMSDVEFRMRNFGETEEVARKMLAMIAPPVDPFATGSGA